MLAHDHSRNLLPHALCRMRENPLFSCYGDNDLTHLAAFSRLEWKRAGSVLFHEDEPCQSFYFLNSGLVQLYRDAAVGPPEQTKVVEFIEEGESFVEGALFSGQGYPVAAKTLEDSELIRIDAVRFSRFISVRPRLCWRMLGGLGSHLHQLVGQIASLSLHNAEQKVAVYLLEHADGDDDKPVVRPLPSRRRELASRLNLSVETLCRVLSHFRRAGWILTEGSSGIRILEKRALQQVLDPSLEAG